VSQKLDLRGLACPGPVVRVKKALEETESGSVLAVVDNPESRENVQRFAKSKGYGVSVEEKGETFEMTVTKGGEQAAQAGPAAAQAASAGELVLFVTTPLVGDESPELGAILARAFYKTLLDVEDRPDRIIFMHAGVRLSIEGSPVLGSLKDLHCQGVDIMSCGTCLDFFGLTEKLAVGVVSNMFEITEALLGAGRVVRI